MNRFLLLSIVIGEMIATAVWGQPSSKVLFFSFESATEIWNNCPDKDNRVKRITVTKIPVLEGNQALEIQMLFPGEGGIEKPFYCDLTRYRFLIFNVYAAEVPEDLKLLFFLQDGDWLWYQTALQRVQKNRWNKFTFSVQPDSTQWGSINHSQPWSAKSASNIKKIGMKVFCQTPAEVTLWLDEISGELICFPELSFSAKQVPQYQKLEITFHLPETLTNPFDPEEVEVIASFTEPGGSEIPVNGFYYQNYQATLSNGQETLTPLGYPCWKIRFSPEKCGQYTGQVTVKLKTGEYVSSKFSFMCLPSNHPGFIKVSPLDHRYFQFSDGRWFYPLGLNIRSPTDTRYARMRKRSLEPDSGTAYYEKIFKEMKESGQNFAEVWMASWFTALEWVENRPGYKGAGSYNLRHAWKLDRLLELAEQNGIYLQIVLINHGQLSTYCDEEWADHPYNVKNSGFLKDPEEFFTHPKAEELTRRKLKYIVARWGYSPHIFSWVILNEINLTGTRRDFYLTDTVNLWYEKMGRYLKEIDLSRHLVSAHYTILVDNKLLRSPVVDYIITNAYYQPGKTSLVNFVEEIYSFNARFGKPVFVSEYGGSPWGASEPNLIRDVVAGIWSSFHLPLAGGPLFWWHRLIGELNLYPFYKSLSAYLAGEDRIRTDLAPEPIEIKGKVKALSLGNNYQSLVWLYDPAVMGDLRQLDFPEHQGVKIMLKNKVPGTYQVEYWSMEKGLISQTSLQHLGNALVVSLPPFRHWLALKIKVET
ncbi:MAG: DUF5060 domain-containing protein [Candidatus Omnitrophica bacterium]|nr:DUF5060 domain-containing protein [Candidatus Omnitrophota bacterium]